VAGVGQDGGDGWGVLLLVVMVAEQVIWLVSSL